MNNNNNNNRLMFILEKSIQVSVWMFFLLFIFLDGIFKSKNIYEIFDLLPYLGIGVVYCITIINRIKRSEFLIPLIGLVSLIILADII